MVRLVHGMARWAVRLLMAVGQWMPEGVGSRATPDPLDVRGWVSGSSMLERANWPSLKKSLGVAARSRPRAVLDEWQKRGCFGGTLVSRAPRGDTGTCPRTLDTPGHVTRIPGERPWRTASRTGKSWTRPPKQAPPRENGAHVHGGQGRKRSPPGGQQSKIAPFVSLARGQWPRTGQGRRAN
jgi:hypothetical protein